MLDIENEDADARFAASVRELRAARGWSQAELADRMVRRGITEATQVTVSRIEAGKRIVRLAEAQAIAAIFGRPLGTMTSPGELSLALDAARVALGEARRAQSDIYTAVRRVIEAENTAKELAESLAEVRQASKDAADAESLNYARKLEQELLQAANWSSAEELSSVYTFELDTSDREWRNGRVALDGGGYLLIEDSDGEYQAEA